VEASIRAIKYGLQGEVTVNGETYNNIMTPLGLDDKEVADVMNYILNSWGNEAEAMITEAEVAEVSE
jgi:mono/diheme cytochrome c family protein